MPALPSSLALTTIADGTQIVAVDHRNNYTSVQTAMNALITALGGGTAGQYLTALSPSAIGWASAPVPVNYRKTSVKTVNSSVGETDLLNGEITVAGGAMGATATARLVAWGETFNNSGAATTLPRWKLKLGGTTLIDTNVGPASSWGAAGTSRLGWRLSVEIVNAGVTNVQAVSFQLIGPIQPGGANPATTAFTAGNGAYQLHGIGASGYTIVAQGTAAGALDMTASKLLEFTITLPVSNPSLEVKLLGALFEVI